MDRVLSVMGVGIFCILYQSFLEEQGQSIVYYYSHENSLHVNCFIAFLSHKCIMHSLVFNVPDASTICVTRQRVGDFTLS